MNLPTVPKIKVTQNLLRRSLNIYYSEYCWHEKLSTSLWQSTIYDYEMFVTPADAPTYWNDISSTQCLHEWLSGHITCFRFQCSMSPTAPETKLTVANNVVVVSLKNFHTGTEICNSNLLLLHDSTILHSSLFQTSDSVHENHEFFPFLMIYFLPPSWRVFASQWRTLRIANWKQTDKSEIISVIRKENP